MNHLSLRALGRRQIAIVTAALVAFLGFALVRSQTGAHADTVTSNQKMTCPIIGALDTPFTAVDTPDPATPGGQLTLEVNPSAPVPPGITVTINTITLTYPLPAQVQSVDNVTFADGGNMVGSYTVAADNSSVAIVYTGPQSTDVIKVPASKLFVTLKASASGNISWPGPTGIKTNLVGLGDQACTATAGNPPMQTTAVSPPVTIPPTTAPPTTAPPTTKPDHGENPFIKLIKQLLCMLFHICQ